jgi:hypothetical protein
MFRTISLTTCVVLFVQLGFAQTTTNNYVFFNENRSLTAARNWAIRQNNSAEGDFQIGFTGTNTGGLPNFSSTPLDAKFTIKNTGKIGIGKINPTLKLDVYTDGMDGIQISHSGGNWTRSFAYLESNMAYNNISLAGDAALIFGKDSGTTGGFVLAPMLGGGASGLRISNTGNVGIGVTDTKGYRLAVGGKAVVEEVVVKLQAAWPDYVFKPSYTLRPLADVRTYIDEHGHLPELPSAKDVAENGVAIGETEAILLKKVEEMTLYILQQEERIKKLEERLEQK